MSLQNFSFLAGLEVPEKFVVVVVEHVATVSNLNEVAFELLCVELLWVLTIIEQNLKNVK